ncbi:MAG: DUF4272 domain-containing protein [Actinomycetota bacterium]|nr:DUF4272 domain-containing protein [Actinomycetota bacterium]
MPSDSPIVPVVQHPTDVLVRARCLAATALVAFASGDDEQLDLADQLADGVQEALTPLERRALGGGVLESEQLSRLSWQTVSAGVLLWALQRLEEGPRGDHPPNAREVINNLLENPDLASEDNLRAMAELRTFSHEARAWAWATRNEQLVRSTGSTSLQQPVPENARAVPVFSRSDAPTEAPIEVDGVPLREVDDHRLDQLISINSERLRASRWLLGEAEWDVVALSV